MTVADIANFAWANCAFWIDIEIGEFPLLSAWVDRINAREAVKRGLDVPTKFTLKEAAKDKEKAEKEAKATSSWVMQGQKEDAEKKYKQQ